MEKFSEKLMSILDRIHSLFNYPEEEKRIPKQATWATDNGPILKDFIDDFKIPKGKRAKLIKMEIIQGRDDPQQLNSCLYALKENEIIFDHHYYSDDGWNYFIIAAPEDFPKKYRRIKKYGGKRNSIKKIHILFENGTYHMIVIGEEYAHIVQSTIAEWARTLYDIAQNEQAPYNKSRTNINSDKRFAIYCSGLFTTTTLIGERTNMKNEKHLVARVKLEKVADRNAFETLKRKYRL